MCVCLRSCDDPTHRQPSALCKKNHHPYTHAQADEVEAHEPQVQAAEQARERDEKGGEQQRRPRRQRKRVGRVYVAGVEEAGLLARGR